MQNYLVVFKHIKTGLFTKLKILANKLWSYTLLLSLLFWTLLGLVLAKPTEISTLEYEAEEYEHNGFNNTDEPSFIQVHYIDKSYRIYFTDVNWFTALEFCSYYGQNLASISSQTDKLQMIATLNQYGKYCPSLPTRSLQNQILKRIVNSISFFNNF